MDYLVLSSSQGETSYVPLRAETSFFEISGGMFYEILGSAKDLLFTFSGESLAFILGVALMVYVLFQGFTFFKSDSGFLMYRALAKNRITLCHPELVEGSFGIYKKSG